MPFVRSAPLPQEDIEDETGDDGVPPILSVKSHYGLFAVSRSLRHRVGAAIAVFALVAVVAWAGVKAVPWEGHPQPVKPDPSPQQKQVMIRQMQVCSYDLMPVCPASDLFRSIQVHEVVTENIMRAGGNRLLYLEDREAVRTFVAEGLVNISSRLHKAAPELARELDMLQLSRELRDAVLSSMRIMGDPRVQSIGRDVARAIRSSPSAGKEQLLRRIRAQLWPRADEIRALRDELTPDSLRQVWGSSHQWSMTLESENLRVMRATSGGRFAPVGVSLQDVYDKETMNTPTPREEKVFGSVGALLEQARALLESIRISTRLFGRELPVPSMTPQLLNGVPAPDDRLMSCELRVSKEHRTSFTRALYCPLKFGSQGLDALRAADTTALAVHT